MVKVKSKQKNLAAQALGSLGGKARAEALSAEDRKKIAGEAGKKSRDNMSAKRKRAIAKKAARARWEKEKRVRP
jgi:hypothetical protein